MAGLKLENEEQAKKAEANRDKLRKELKNPLLDDVERLKTQRMIDRLTEVIDAYRQENPAPAPPVESQVKAPIVIQEAAPQSRDPRPDLKEDAYLWTELLRLAEEKDAAAGREYGKVDTLCGVLNGFHCGGTRLKEGKVAGTPMWVLKPDIDPSGRNAWESIEEYNHMKMQFLSSWSIELTELLKELTKRQPLPTV